MKFEIKGFDSQPKEFIIDGEVIAYSSYEEDGWNGMDKLKNMFERFAALAGEEITRIEHGG